jgi:hypothetical protein
MNGTVTILIALLAKLVPAVAGNSETVTAIVNALIELVPVLVKEYQDVLPYVKNIIAVLKKDPATTQAQLDQLATLDQQVDAAFEAAATDAQAEESAAATQ